jgi:hypothetical protein
MPQAILSFAAHVDDKGVAHLKDKERWDREMRHMAGADIDIEIHLRKKGTKRRRAENYLWGVVLRMLEDHTGSTKEELYEDYMRMKFPKFVDDPASKTGSKKSRASSPRESRTYSGPRTPMTPTTLAAIAR